MRLVLIPLALIVASCGRSEAPAEDAATSSAPSAAIKGQWGSGRDRLCVGNDRAGLITYAAAGDANCMVRGTASSTDGMIRIRPDGDEQCAIDARVDQGAVILGDVSPACAYYCGPKASYSGKRLEPTETNQPALDLAGEPLC